jgi:hypothetical protein
VSLNAFEAWGYLVRREEMVGKREHGDVVADVFPASRVSQLCVQPVSND